jgi:DNA replication protein DnaC
LGGAADRGATRLRAAIQDRRRKVFAVFSQRYERTSMPVTSNLPFAEWTEILRSERRTGALLDRLTHHVHILKMNGDSFRLKKSRKKKDPGPQ